MSSNASRRRSASVSPGSGEHLGEHRHHDLGPALTDQRQRAVEIEQNVADAGTRCEGRAENYLAGKLGLHRAVAPCVMREQFFKPLIFTVVS